jgi:hypothetical protein
VFGRGEEFVFVAERCRETRRAKVVGFADEDGALESRVFGEMFGGREDAAAEREVFGFELFLERDRVR